MISLQLVCLSFLFFLGIIGIVINRQSVIITIMCIELMLLALNLNFVTLCNYLDDMLGVIFCIFILTVAAAESSIGLAILISFSNVFGTVSAADFSTPCRR